ncbi:MAG TPA: hypothetical protein VGC67_17345 [Cellulomonas sp.]
MTTFPERQAALDLVLSAREPDLLTALKAGQMLSTEELRRVDAALVAEGIAQLGPQGEVTPTSELVRTTTEFVRALVPQAETAPLVWGRWLTDDDTPADPYDDAARIARGGGPPRRDPEEDIEWRQPLPPSPHLSSSTPFGRLVPQLERTLHETLTAREPKILETVRAGGGLTAAARERVADALYAEALDRMTHDLRPTAASEFLRVLIWATNRLVPTRPRELPGWGTWKMGDPLPTDRCGDGGAANGYGPQPSTAM